MIADERDLFIPILLGTFRKERESEKAARWMHGQMTARDGVETVLFDVRDFKFTGEDYGPDIKGEYPEWRDAIIRADGLIVVTPEYNRGYPGPLKSVLDLLLKEYIHKAVGVVSVSAGAWGGVRVVENLLPVFRELGLVTTFSDINFPSVKTKFDESGVIADQRYEKISKDFLDELLWMASTLRWGRENLPSKYHSDIKRP